ncbi:MAG: N-acetylmuramoyl-L-alanine amidase [Oleibacter sp.]|nr:N-acetylmuramoyl-L-alanine amidase [Thalassolituus sp.]
MNEIIIHCADVPNGRGDTVEDINRWHRERGFTRDMSIAPEFNQDLQSIGYHYVIEVTGIIQSGRPLTESGAHVSGHNFNTVGICLIGRDQFTPDQWQSLRQLILDLRALLPAYTSVKGHREYNNNKTCPGFDVRTYAAQDYFPEAAHILKIT